MWSMARSGPLKCILREIRAIAAGQELPNPIILADGPRAYALQAVSTQSRDGHTYSIKSAQANWTRLDQAGRSANRT